MLGKTNKLSSSDTRRPNATTFGNKKKLKKHRILFFMKYLSLFKKIVKAAKQMTPVKKKFPVIM
jgi:hypothetical protein